MDSISKTFAHLISSGQRFSRNLDHIIEKFEELSKDENNLDEVDLSNFTVTNAKGFLKRLQFKEKVFGKSKMATDETHGSHQSGRDDIITDNTRKPGLPADPMNIVSPCSGETVTSRDRDEHRSPNYKGIMFRSLLDLDESIRMDNLIDTSEGESLSSVSIISSEESLYDEESNVDDFEEVNEIAESSLGNPSELASDEVDCEASESSNADDSDQDHYKKSTTCNNANVRPSLDEHNEACFGEILVSEQSVSSINTNSTIGRVHSCKQLFSPAGGNCATSMSTSGSSTGVPILKDVVSFTDHLICYDLKSSHSVKKVSTTLLGSDKISSDSSPVVKHDANKRKMIDETFVMENREFPSEAQKLTSSPHNLFTNSLKPGHLNTVLSNRPASKKAFSCQLEDKVIYSVNSPALQEPYSTESNSNHRRISTSQTDASRCHNIKSLILQHEYSSCHNVQKFSFNNMHEHKLQASNKFTGDKKQLQQAKRISSNSRGSNSMNRMTRQQLISKNLNNETFTFENSNFCKSSSDSRIVNVMSENSLKSVCNTTSSNKDEFHLPYTEPDSLCFNAPEHPCANKNSSINCALNKNSLNETFIKHSMLLPIIKPECSEFADDSNDKSIQFLDVSILGCSPDVSQTRSIANRKPSHILVNNASLNIDSVQHKSQMSKTVKSSSSCQSSFIRKNISNDNNKLIDFQLDKVVTRREQCLKLPEITESNLVEEAHIQASGCYDRKLVVDKENLDCMLKEELMEKEKNDSFKTLLFHNIQNSYKVRNSIPNPMKAHGNSNSNIPDVNVSMPLDLSRSSTMRHTMFSTDAKIETVAGDVLLNPDSEIRPNETEVRITGNGEVKLSASISRCSKLHKEQETLHYGKESRAKEMSLCPEKCENLRVLDKKSEEVEEIRHKKFIDSYNKFRAKKLEKVNSVIKPHPSSFQFHERLYSFPGVDDDDSLCQKKPVIVKTPDRIHDYSPARGSLNLLKNNEDFFENYGTQKEPEISTPCNKVESNFTSLCPGNLNVSNSKEEAERRRKEFNNCYKKFRADRLTVSESTKKSLQSVSKHSVGFENCSLLDDSDFLYQNKKTHSNISSSIGGCSTSPRNSLLRLKCNSDVLVSDDAYQSSLGKVKQHRKDTESTTDDDVFNISNYSDSLYSLTNTRKRKRSELTRPDLNRSDNKLSYSVKAKISRNFVSGCESEYKIENIHHERISGNEDISTRNSSNCNEDSSSYSDQVSPTASEVKRSRTESRDSIEDDSWMSPAVRWLSKTQESRKVLRLLTCLK